MAVLLADETVGAVATNGFQQRDGRSSFDAHRRPATAGDDRARAVMRDLRPIRASIIIRTGCSARWAAMIPR